MILEKFYERLKSELTIRFPTGLFCVLLTIYYLYTESEVNKLLSIYFQPDTIYLIKTGILEINRVLRCLCIVETLVVFALRIISASTKIILNQNNHLSSGLDSIADELNNVLCETLPVFTVSVLFVMIIVRHKSTMWTPVDELITMMFTLIYFVMWIQHAVTNFGK